MSGDPGDDADRSDEVRDRVARALTIVAVLATISYPAWADSAAAVIGRFLAGADPGAITSPSDPEMPRPRPKLFT